MPRRPNPDDRNDDWADGDEDDLPEGVYHDDPAGDGTDPCPHCGHPVYEGASFCVKCENFISREDSSGRRPAWVWVGLFVALAVAVWWAIAG